MSTLVKAAPDSLFTDEEEADIETVNEMNAAVEEALAAGVPIWQLVPPEVLDEKGIEYDKEAALADPDRFPLQEWKDEEEGHPFFASLRSEGWDFLDRVLAEREAQFSE